MANGLALVTGASSGIGLELARVLAKEGYDLIVCSAGERLESASSDLELQGVKVTSVSADLATREGVDELWAACEAAGAPIDIACINAGVGVGGKFVETSLDEELNLIALELRAHGSPGEARGAADGAARRGEDPVYGFDCRRDGSASGSGVRGVEGVCAVVCA